MKKFIAGLAVGLMFAAVPSMAGEFGWSDSTLLARVAYATEETKRIAAIVAESNSGIYNELKALRLEVAALRKPAEKPVALRITRITGYASTEVK